MSRDPEEEEPAAAETSAPDDESGPVDKAAEVSRRQRARAAVIESAQRCPFGPVFFMTQLRGFAGEECPDPAAGLPVVELHLATGDVLDLCHVIGLTPAWVALAVHETGYGGPVPHMRTEFVPFELIARVTLRPSRPEAPHLGFDHARVPRVMGDGRHPELTPEAAIEAAAAKRAEGQHRRPPNR